MTALNPPGWLQNAGSTHTAAQLRQYIAGLVAGRLTTSSLRARSGINPYLGDQFVTTQTGSPSMAVLVGTGIVCIAGSESSTQANYWDGNDAQVTLSVTAAHATLPRIDLVVFNIRDSFYSTAFNDGQLQVIAGTPASSPVAPTPPANSITIAQIAVGAAVTSIVNANITDVRNYVAALGGVINSRTLAAAPVSTEIGINQLVGTLDTKKIYNWDGSAYYELGRVNDVNTVIDAIETDVTATQVTSGTTELDLARLASASLSVSTDRLYQTDIQIITSRSVATDEYLFRLRQGTALSGTLVGEVIAWVVASTSGQFAKASILWTPASTTTTNFYLSVLRNGGTGALTVYYDNFATLARTQVIHRRLGPNTLLRTITT